MVNVATGAQQEVVHSRVRSLQLCDLENLCFATPGLFDRLVDLRRKLRNSYRHGSKTSKQLHQIPFEDSINTNNEDSLNTGHNGGGGAQEPEELHDMQRRSL